VNLLGYWGVLKSQWRVVAIGIALSLLLSALALYRVSPDGVSLRSPPVYVAKSTLLVGGGGGAQAIGTTVAPEYLAQIYAQLAQSDAVRRLVDPTLKRALTYGVDPVTGINSGTPLPLLSVSAYSTSQSAAIALANRVARSLVTYVATSRTLPKAQRSSLTVVARPDKADVFKGKRLTPSLMLFVLGITGTVFLAFTRHNLRHGSQDIEARDSQVEPPQDVDVTDDRVSALHDPHERRVAVGGRAMPRDPRTSALQ
jgi:capsular polysaccharide biosynthesis protein